LLGGVFGQLFGQTCRRPGDDQLPSLQVWLAEMEVWITECDDFRAATN
jgi:hypothetical protein